MMGFPVLYKAYVMVCCCDHGKSYGGPEVFCLLNAVPHYSHDMVYVVGFVESCVEGNDFIFDI